MSINTPYGSSDLDTSRIIKTGNSYFIVKSSRDADSTAPTVNGHLEEIAFASQENTTQNYRPYLSVTTTSTVNSCQSNTNGTTGNWSDASSWTSCGDTTPQSGDSVTILDSHTITMTADVTRTTGLTTINSGGILNVGAHNFITTTLANSGRITTSGSGSNLQISTSSIGNITFTSNAENIPAKTYNSLILQNGGTSTGDTTISFLQGSLNARSYNLRITASNYGTITTSGNGSNLTFNYDAGNVTFTGVASSLPAETYDTLTLNAGGTLMGYTYVTTLNITAGTLVAGNYIGGTTLNNSGLITTSGTGSNIAFSSSNYGNVTFTNTASDFWAKTYNTLTLQNGGTLSGDSTTTVTTFSNTGTFQIGGSGETRFKVTGNAINNGSITFPEGNSGDMDVDGNLTAGTIGSGSVVNVGGNLSGVTSIGSYLRFDGAGTQTLDSGGHSFPGIDHTGSGTLRLVNNNFDINGYFANFAGTFDSNNLNMNFASNWNNTGSAIFTRGSGTLTFDGTSTVINSSSKAASLGIVTISGTMTLGSNLTATNIVNGTLNMGINRTLTLTGTDMPLDIATFQKGTGSTVSYAGRGPTSISAFQYNNLTISNAGVFYLTGHLDAANSKNMTGNLLINNEALLVTNNYNLDCVDLTIANPGEFTAGSSTITIAGNFNLDGGTFNAGASTINVGGNWSKSGSFVPSTSSVILNGAGDTAIDGSTEFNDLHLKSEASAKGRTISFTANSTQTVGHVLEIQGSSGKILKLSRSGSANYWKLNLQKNATQTVNYVNVANSDASSGNTIHAGLTSTGSNTKNWLFTENPVVSINKSSYTFGQWTTDTQPIIAFTLEDSDTQTAIGKNQKLKYQIQIASDKNFTNLVTDYSSSFATPSTHTKFVVGQILDQNNEQGTYAIGSAGQQLYDGLYYWRIKSLDSNGGDSGWQPVGELDSSVIKIGNSDIAGLFNPRTSTISSDKKDVKNDGTDFATITVVIKDSKGNPIKNKDINLTSSRQKDKIESIGNPSTTNKYYSLSDESGKAIFKISSYDAGESTLKATNMTDDLSLDAKIIVDFNSSLSAAGDAISSTIANMVTSETTKQVAKKVLKPVSQAAAAAGGLAILVQGVAALPSVFQFIAYLFAMMGEALGVKRRPKNWGMVFDSFTGKPMDLAVVRLFDADTKALIATRVSDLAGRFGFSVDPGAYVVSVTKPGYLFPVSKNSLSTIARGQSYYVGATLTIKEKMDNLSLTIPIEPIKTKMNFYSKARILARDISGWISKSSIYILVPILVIGTVVYGLMAYVTSDTKYYVTMDIYIVMSGFYILQKVRSNRQHGTVFGQSQKDKKKLERLPNSIIYLFDAEFETLRSEVQTDKNGQYTLYVPKGKYYLTAKADGYKMNQDLDVIKKGQTHTGKYYRGGIIELKQNGFINVEIKMKKG